MDPPAAGPPLEPSDWRPVAARRARSYAIVVAMVGLAAWLKVTFPQYVGPLFILFYPVVMAGAVLGGLVPGLLATGASAIITATWVLPSELHGTPLGLREGISLGLFSLMGVSMSVLAETSRRARSRAVREAARREVVELEARAAAAQAEALQRYDLLAAHSRDVIVFIRLADGRILDANVAATVAYRCPREELLTLHVQDLRAPEERAATVGQMAAANAGGLRFETVHQRRDGSRFPVEVVSQGATIGGTRMLVSVVRDITERRRVEEELRSADQRKSEFLALLSHELRNPLATIRNGAAILGRAPPGSEAATRAVEMLNRQTGYLARLVDDLLDLTRVTHGKIELQLARVDAAEMARRCSDDARFAFEAGGVVLSCAAPEPVWVDADAVRLAQMLGNLLGNALKYTPVGGRVELRVERQGRDCRIAVRDTGEGIEPGDLSRIFQPFVQVRSPRLEARGGLGLGLALVEELARLHGGSASATSAGRGQGSEFLIRLPLAAAPAAVAAPPPQLPAAGLSILVIEDEADSGATLAELLTMWGHRVVVAATGQAGVAAAAERPPQVVICDVGLPDMTGYQVVRALREAPATAGATAIALTGHALPEDRRRALEAGFDAHLAKPVSLDDLGELLARVPGAAPPRRSAPAHPV